ncbi:hypothetical protein BU24DRAFT_278886 [Aaosphaeria arxii CBS 175.79]|uniref:Uncharacterized protein n=1 Tax=Aaosphaeria arxii CBS 175.79 TaxID=1450172 RepID=A0A6A5XDW9_9PLEO|nr:uncharacterized protein BU24DRAFT_278886 [Aaosphaeria arxii CBS 175.79]KAF2011335.1 hypothetical protein BU24DRAFT_278886 [Aaosphaeria arxii CBS 175.79]
MFQIGKGYSIISRYTICKARLHFSKAFYEYQLLDAQKQLYKKGEWVREKVLKKGDLTKKLYIHEDIPADNHHIASIDRVKTEIDEILDTDSDAGTDIASIFSDGGISTSSASTASLNPVQTIGIREVSRALLSQEDLKTLYTLAVLNVERRKARVHIRGFIKEYGRNLLKEASNRILEVQAAKFVQELAGRIADEIIWTIAGFEETNRSPDPRLGKKDLETWLSSLQPQSVDAKEPNPIGLAESADETFEESESDEELNDGLLFPNIDKVKDFLLDSEAFRIHVTAMRTWLKVDGDHSRDTKKPAEKMPVHTDTEEETEEETQEETEEEAEVETEQTLADLAASEPGQQQTEHGVKLPAELRTYLQQDMAQEPKSKSRARQNRGSYRDLISGLLDFWGVSFFFYDLVEILVPRVRPGYRRLRWRCVSLGVPHYSLKLLGLLTAQVLQHRSLGRLPRR